MYKETERKRVEDREKYRTTATAKNAFKNIKIFIWDIRSVSID